jgi:hypothetical protein
MRRMGDVDVLSNDMSGERGLSVTGPEAVSA